jgi:hypothetical protein
VNSNNNSNNRATREVLRDFAIVFAQTCGLSGVCTITTQNPSSLLDFYQNDGAKALNILLDWFPSDNGKGRINGQLLQYSFKEDSNNDNNNDDDDDNNNNNNSDENVISSSHSDNNKQLENLKEKIMEIIFTLLGEEGKQKFITIIPHRSWI